MHLDFFFINSVLYHVQVVSNLKKVFKNKKIEHKKVAIIFLNLSKVYFK